MFIWCLAFISSNFVEGTIPFLPLTWATTWHLPLIFRYAQKYPSSVKSPYRNALAVRSKGFDRLVNSNMVNIKFEKIAIFFKKSKYARHFYNIHWQQVVCTNITSNKAIVCWMAATYIQYTCLLTVGGEGEGDRFKRRRLVADNFVQAFICILFFRVYKIY